jgi:uncharacterized membrane protein YeaQ/YmgE (transglycosylase-associated protein family)
MGAVLLIILAIVVAVVLGIAVVGLALNLLWWALIGLVIGALARLVLPGTQAIGWLWTILAGVGGALLGGVIADALDVGSILQFLIAIGVAAALIIVLGGSRRTAL